MENHPLLEVLSWRLVTETARRAPSRLRIYEMHPGGGQYDCLALYTIDQELIAYLNRCGRFTPWATLRDKGVAPESAEAWDIWREVRNDHKPVELVDGICKRIGLAVPAKLPSSTAPILVYRFIAEFLSWTVCQPQNWECRSGFLDSSGWGGGVREQLFETFDEARTRLECREKYDLSENPAYRFWFILREGEPVLCLETTGIVWNLNGESMELLRAYRKEKRLWPLIYQMAGNLLP